MKRLFVEELECRNLLSVAAVGHLANHGLESNHVDAGSNQSLVDFGGRERLTNDSNPGSARSQIMASGFDFNRNEVGSGGFDFNPGFSIVEVTVEVVIVVPAQATESTNVPDGGPVFRSSLIRQATESSVNLPEASASLPLATAALSSPRFTGETPDAALVTTAENSSTSLNSAETATALSTNKTGTSLAARTDVAPVGAVGRNIDSAPFAVGSGIRSASGLGSGFEGPISPAPQLPPASPRLPDFEFLPSPLAQSIHAGLAALPQFADMVNAASTMSLSSVEQGIASFLASMDSAPIAALPASNSDLYPWLLAGVVTAVACELARRQLKKPAQASPFELATIPMAPWEVPQEQEHGRRTAR